LENCKEVIDAWVSYFLVGQLTKINKLNVGLGYWGCSMYEQETIRIRQLRAEFEACEATLFLCFWFYKMIMLEAQMLLAKGRMQV